MKLYVEIKADTNDGDYITEKTDITDDKETLALINRVIKAINEITGNKRRPFHNWCTSDYGRGERPNIMYANKLSPEEIEEFSDLCPYGEYGIHTIVSIKLIEVAKEDELFEFSY